MQQATGSRRSEDSINEALAGLLEKHGAGWRVEAAGANAPQHGAGRRPDILVRRGAALIGIETALHPAATLDQDGIRRLGAKERGAGQPIESVIQCVLPAELRSAASDALDSALLKARCQVAVRRHEDGGPPEGDRWPVKGYIDVDYPTLLVCVESALISPSRLRDIAEALGDGVARGAQALTAAAKTRPATTRELAQMLQQAEGAQTNSMAVAVLVNAFAFHETLAGSEHDVKPIARCCANGRVQWRRLAEEWRRIHADINCWPIFKIGGDILRSLQDRESREAVLAACLSTTERLSSADALRTQEIMGAAHQRLISDRHLLKTQYTQPNNALLLAHGVMARLKRQGFNGAKAKDAQVLDPACGTGALLSAMQREINREMRLNEVNDADHHETLMHNLTGLDVMPAAAHLTATQLSSAHPTRTCRQSRVGVVPFGRQGGSGAVALGSLDFLGCSEADLVYAVEPDDKGARGMAGQAGSEGVKLKVGDGEFGAVIMNPPFTSNTKGDGNVANIPLPAWAAFGQSAANQKQMKDEFKRRVSLCRASRKQRPATYREPVGNHQNGLCSWFLDLAHDKLRMGGALGFIVPFTLLGGSSWRKVIDMLREDYRDIVVYSVAAPNASFSADTSIAEVMVLASKCAEGERGDGTALYVNLRRCPDSPMEAAILGGRIASAQSGRTAPRQLNWQKGDVAATCWMGRLGGGSQGAQLRDTMLADVADRLAQGVLDMPGAADSCRIPVTTVGDMGEVGPVHRSIGNREGGKNRHKAGLGPFVLEDLPAGEAAMHPMLWNHHCEAERRLVVQPDAKGVLPMTMGRADEAHKRREKAGKGLWERHASRLHINLEFRLNSQSLAACLTPEPCLGGRAWPTLRTDCETPLLLWANSTMGMMLRWWESSRTVLGRANMTVATLASHTTLDCSALSAQQLRECDLILAETIDKTFRPANEAHMCDARAELDEALLTRVFGLSSQHAAAWRNVVKIWCQEPSVKGAKKSVWREMARTADHCGQDGLWPPTLILNVIDERIREARRTGRTSGPGIAAARDNLARLLQTRDAWPKPATINADAESEILVVWRSAHGKVEIDTEDDGSAGYYVTRTLSKHDKEGAFSAYDANEMNRVMRWLDAPSPRGAD